MSGEPLDLDALEACLRECGQFGVSVGRDGVVITDQTVLGLVAEVRRLRADVVKLKAAWNNCGARMEHDCRCALVTSATPYPRDNAAGCDCGLTNLVRAMETP